MELGEDFNKAIREGFRVVMDYFSDILFITYRISPPESKKKTFLTLIHLGLKEDEIFLKMIDYKPYTKYLYGDYLDLSPVDRIKLIKENIENDVKVIFKGCFGFDINILSDIISPKNIESLLKIKNMSRQLPLIASISALFAGMKALNVEETIKKEGSILTISKSIEKTMEEQEEESKTVAEPLQFKKFFDSYLKRGIVFISDESHTMKQIRSPLFSKEGYLGLDLDLIQELIKKKNGTSN